MIKKILIFFFCLYSLNSLAEEEANFSIWLNDFKFKAIKLGISKKTVNRTFKNTKYLKKVIIYS